MKKARLVALDKNSETTPGSSGQKKTRVLVIYGGKSGEHEISLRSAASVFRSLDRSRYEVIPMGIDKQGVWRTTDPKWIQKILDHPEEQSVIIDLESPPLSPGDFQHLNIDVVFPVMHGPFYEDGAIQGLFELLDVPYVGSGVLGSAAGMDKDVAKRLARDGGLPVVPFITLKSGPWISETLSSDSPQYREVVDRVKRELKFPVFVKPANLGSSVGVHKVKEPEGFKQALLDAFRYDSKVLVEKAIRAREIEFAILENEVYGEPARVSVPGEIVPAHEFYSYEAKYLDENGAKLMIPAPMNLQQTKLGEKIARQAFELIECEGFARVDLFLDQDSGEFYLNEVNTIPGFTSISMYPKLWGYSGISYAELLTHLIELALARHRRKSKFIRDYL